MMNPIQWLKNNAAGFNSLSIQEYSAPMHFSLLWSHFEAVALNGNASVEGIANWIKGLDDRNALIASSFDDALNFFKTRYYSHGEKTQHFASLNLRGNDNPILVENVLSGKNTNSVDGIITVFIIIYRYRNNYFHGLKWAYEMKDQKDNFDFANVSIMKIMGMARN